MWNKIISELLERFNFEVSYSKYLPRGVSGHSWSGVNLTFKLKCHTYYEEALVRSRLEHPTFNQILCMIIHCNSPIYCNLIVKLATSGTDKFASWAAVFLIFGHIFNENFKKKRKKCLSRLLLACWYHWQYSCYKFDP